MEFEEGDEDKEEDGRAKRHRGSNFLHPDFGTASKVKSLSLAGKRIFSTRCEPSMSNFKPNVNLTEYSGPDCKFA
jgi:hypothetical protein